MISKREKILEAASQLFAQKDFHEITVEKIARQAKVAKGTLYLYFKNKVDLYVALAEDRIDKVIEIIESVAQREMSPRQKLEGILKQTLGLLTVKKQIMAAPILDRQGLSRRMIKGLKARFFPKVIRLHQMVSEIFKQGCKEGEFKNIDPDRLSILFMGLVHSSVTYRFLFGAATDPIEDLSLLKEVFFYGIANPVRNSKGLYSNGVKEEK